MRLFCSLLWLDVPDLCMYVKIGQRKLVSLSTVLIISNLISIPGVEERKRLQFCP